MSWFGYKRRRPSPFKHIQATASTLRWTTLCAGVAAVNGAAIVADQMTIAAIGTILVVAANAYCRHFAFVLYLDRQIRRCDRDFAVLAEMTSSDFSMDKFGRNPSMLAQVVGDLVSLGRDAGLADLDSHIEAHRTRLKARNTKSHNAASGLAAMGALFTFVGAGVALGDLDVALTAGADGAVDAMGKVLGSLGAAFWSSVAGAWCGSLLMGGLACLSESTIDELCDCVKAVAANTLPDSAFQTTTPKIGDAA